LNVAVARAAAVDGEVCGEGRGDGVEGEGRQLVPP